MDLLTIKTKCVSLFVLELLYIYIIRSICSPSCPHPHPHPHPHDQFWNSLSRCHYIGKNIHTLCGCNHIHFVKPWLKSTQLFKSLSSLYIYTHCLSLRLLTAQKKKKFKAESLIKYFHPDLHIKCSFCS